MAGYSIFLLFPNEKMFGLSFVELVPNKGALVEGAFGVIGAFLKMFVFFY